MRHPPDPQQEPCGLAKIRQRFESAVIRPERCRQLNAPQPNVTTATVVLMYTIE